MIHTRTKIIALISFGIFLSSGILYGGFFWFLSEQKQSLYEARVSAVEADVQARALDALEATVQSSKEDREKLKGYILADEEIIDLLSLIEQTALEQGTTLTTEGLTVEPIDDVFEELQISVAIEGSFDGVMRMLRIVELIPEQSSVSHVVIGRTGEEGGDTWEGRVEIRVVKFKKL